MAQLARHRPFCNCSRFAVTLTGIALALMLIVIQFRFFLGFLTCRSRSTSAEIGGLPI